MCQSGEILRKPIKIQKNAYQYTEPRKGPGQIKGDQESKNSVKFRKKKKLGDQ